MIKFSELETKYNLKTVKSFIADNKNNALKYAESIGYPVALKIESPDILHKSDIGAVKLNLEDADHLSYAYDEIFASVKKNFPDAICFRLILYLFPAFILTLSRLLVIGPMMFLSNLFCLIFKSLKNSSAFNDTCDFAISPF